MRIYRLCPKAGSSQISEVVQSGSTTRRNKFVSQNGRILLANLSSRNTAVIVASDSPWLWAFKTENTQLPFRYFGVRQQYPVVFRDSTSAYVIRINRLAYKISRFHRGSQLSKNHFATEPDAGRCFPRVCVPTMNKARGVASSPGGRVTASSW